MNNYQRKRIDEAVRKERRLTVWEQTFIEKLADYDEDEELTAKQNSKLNEICKRINFG